MLPLPAGGHHRGTLGDVAGLAVVLFPVLLMAFALSMERVEARLSTLVVEEDSVEEFLDQASSAEVNTFLRRGLPHALADFRRHRTGRRGWAAIRRNRVR